MKFGTLQVFPRQGLLQEYGLDLPSAVVGRGEGSNIHIDDFSISRRHARLTVESGRLLVEDLGSVGGTFIDGERLEPGTRYLVGEDSSITFGEIAARYIPSEVEEVVQVPESDAGLEFGGTGGLRVALVSPQVPIEPGKSAAATVVVHNAGRILDDVRIEVPDLPADWYTIDSPSFAILPAGRVEVRVTLHPPRNHESTAGVYSFTARARSTEYDDHPEAQGSFDVLPFEAAELSLLAIRSKRDFRLVAENHGNDVARYTLGGRDEEQVFRYEFETPVVELQPGERRIVNLAVRRPRQLFGPPQIPPFEITGVADSGAEITARGQLAVRPPLQKFRMPVMFTLVALVLLATAAAIFIITDGGGTKSANAEDPYAGVHLCEDKNAKDEQAKKNEEAARDKPLTSATVVGPYDGGRPIFQEVDSNGAPFFAQNDARWATQEYARSTELPNGKDWCGTTIEQCGCAMTSVSVMLALYGLLQMPDGTALSPRALNDWFNGAARQTDRGWVSRGYIYGDVIWSAANELSAEIAKVRPGARTVRFVRTGSGSEDEIRAELKAGRPVILEVPGHWIAAVGLDEDGSILINDPFYRDRKTLDAYKGKVRSSVHYEPSSDLSSVVITAPADVKFKITDKQGRVVNTGTGTLDQPADALNQIPGASVASRHAWRDPTCIETAPPTDAGTNQVVLPGARDDYVIEIVGTGTEPAALAIHTYGRDGASSIATIEGAEGTKAEVAFDPSADKPVIRVTDQGTPQATSTPEPGGSGGGTDETPTPAPTPAPASPTATPFVEQRTAMTLPAEPGQTRVEVATNSGFELGDPIRFAPGLPNEEDNIIVGFGSFILATPLKFAHSPGEPIQRLPRPPGQGPGLPPGITPPPDTGPLEPPETVTMGCSTIYQNSPKLATFICDVQVVGDFTTTRWTINGTVVTEFSGSTSIVMTFPDDTPANVSATVCNVTLCRSTSRNERVEFPLTATGTGTGGTGASAVATPTATPRAGTVTVTCTTEFNQAVTPAIANITCTANFSGDYTGVSWSAPGGSPASGSGTKKTFTTQLKNDLNSPTSIKITATVCNFGTCFTSSPVTVGVGHTRTVVDADPPDGVPKRQTVTLLAVVTGLNGIIPQGGSVQFYADDLPLSPSASLFTVGSLAVAQISIQTGGAAGLATEGTHTIKAVYSGGINAFGSESLPRDYEILQALADGCDSVDEDHNGDTDETCDFSLPKNLGAGTILNSLTISGGTQDGVSNAVIASPGQQLTVTGTVSRTEYCPGCIRQVYLGIGANSVTAEPARGPQCVFSGFPPQTPASTPFATWNLKAPTVPGVYYIRATTTLDYFCVGPAVGPPDRSVGRIVVQASITPLLDVFANAADALPNSPWDNDLSGATPITRAEAGQKVLIRARVPAGATGAIDIKGFKNAAGTSDVAVVAQICPPSGTVPSGTFMGSACIPGEARVLSPDLLDSSPSLSLTATYRFVSPLKLVDPKFGFNDPVTVAEYPVYLPGPPSAEYALRILVATAVTLTASPNPVEMGQQFTLTATVAPAVPPTTGTASPLGGTVQFWAGPDNDPANSNPIGSPVPVDASGVASITWTPRNCDNRTGAANPCPNKATNPYEGFPFDTKDDDVAGRSYYNNVHAEYITGGNSDLKSATSSNINVDVDPAPSTATISIVGVGATGPCTTSTTFLVDDVLCVSATLTGHNGISPNDATLHLRVGSNELSSATVGGCTLTGSDYSCSAELHYTTGVNGAPLANSGTYDLYVRFEGTSDLAADDSPAFPITLSKAAASISISTPSPVTIGTNATLQAVVNPTCSGGSSSCAKDGTVSFYLGSSTTGTLLGTSSPLSGSSTTASVSVSTSTGPLAAAGTYTGITARYNGTSKVNAADSANSVSLTVNRATPTISVGSLTRASDGAPTGTDSVGDTFTLAVGVNPGVSGVLASAGGTLTLTTGTTTLATYQLVATDNGNHTFTLTTSSGPLAAVATEFPLSVSYSGSGTNLTDGSANAGTLGPLAKAAPSVTVSATTPVAITGSVTVTYTIAAPAGLAVACPSASPCVELRAGSSTGTPIATVSVGGTFNALATGGASGTCLDSVGSCTIYVTFTGGTLLNPATGSATVNITKAVPTVTLVASDVIAGASSSLTVTVDGLPTGMSATCTSCVTIKAGTTVVAGPLSYPTGAITVPTGAAGQTGTCLTSAGTCTLTVEYSGNASVGAGSDTDSFTISKASTSVAVTLAPASGSIALGESIDVTATITVTGGGQVVTCTSCLRFRMGSATGTVIGSAHDVSATGQVAITLTGGTSPLGTPASYTIFAVYDESSYVSGANSSATIAVTKAPTSFSAFTASAPGAGKVNLSATVTSPYGGSNAIDSGTIEFYANGTLIYSATANNGSVSQNNVSLAAGTYTITAKYLGSSEYLASPLSAGISVTVT